MPSNSLRTFSDLVYGIYQIQAAAWIDRRTNRENQVCSYVRVREWDDNVENINHISTWINISLVLWIGTIIWRR